MVICMILTCEAKKGCSQGCNSFTLVPAGEAMADAGVIMGNFFPLIFKQNHCFVSCVLTESRAHIVHIELYCLCIKEM